MLTYAGKLYAREDHLRVLEELENSKAQMVELNQALASLQHQVTLTKPLPLLTKLNLCLC
jgi:hypothetical protein